MAWQRVMTTATPGRQALAAAGQARAAVPMTRRVVRGRRRAVGRTIVAYRRGDGTATNYEIARVTVALQHLRAKDDSRARIDPVQRRLYTYGSAGAISPLADQPSHGGVLARRGVRLHPVPRAQHPQHLIIGGATEGVIRPRRPRPRTRPAPGGRAWCPSASRRRTARPDPGVRRAGSSSRPRSAGTGPECMHHHPSGIVILNLTFDHL